MKALLHHLLCPQLGCGKKYINKVQLNVHLLQQHQIQAFRCKIKGCTVSFASQMELSDHRKLAHRNLRTFPCGECERTFPLYRQLYSHSWLYHEAGHFGCRHGRCTFTETTRIKVDNHQWTHRYRQTVHSCTFAGCTETFTCRRSLNAHLRAHEPTKREKKKRVTSYTPSKSYVCLVCKHTFNRKRDSILHKLTHLSVTFHCKWPGCDYSSDLASGVSRHVRGRHFGLQITNKETGKRSIIGHPNVGEFIERQKKTISN